MKVLLATDGAANAEAALDLVLSRPWAAETEFRVISVIEPLHEKLNKALAVFGLTQTAEEAYEKHKVAVQSVVENYANRLAEKFGKQNVTTAVLSGRDREKIVEEAKNFKADAIILGAHGRSEPGEFLFGNVPDYVLTHANCTVEILRVANCSSTVSELETKGQVEEKKFLVALDDSECSEFALQEFLKRELPKESYIKVLSVVDPIPMQTYSGLGPWEATSSENFARLVEKTMEAECAAANKVVERAVKLLQNKFRQAKVEGLSMQGFAKDCILDLASEWAADLIVLGSHGRRGLTGFVLGSVSKAVAIHAPCSILMTRRQTKSLTSESISQTTASLS